jgi:hypothetical protein
MKRHAELRRLSDDHHTALVLGRRLKEHPDASDRHARALLAREVKRTFETELEPHFLVEERWLLPALLAAGAGALVRRTEDEHARLRSIVRGPWSARTPGELGARLVAHVRFEERVLFPAAESLLAPAALAAVGAAARARSG